MCGLAGILHFGALPDAARRVRPMADSLAHRGPDDEGFWSDGDCALGFRRLSILDLEGGHQPMSNEDGTVKVVFNGEIYNHRELRRELTAAGHVFATDHSDTEVLVHGWEEWRHQLPARLNGMFAFVVWDSRTGTLFLARDRYGIKPLYVARPAGGAILFASEIRALHASGMVEARPSYDGILEYFSQQNPCCGRTMFADIEEFPAATWEAVDRNGAARQRFWDFRFERSHRLTLADAADRHREILQRVIERQIAADVPVMGYLSGGIDSGAIVSAAHTIDPRVRGYSCLFDLEGVGEDRAVDEREFSRALAAALAIEHIELELPQDSLARSLDSTIRALETPRMGMAYVNYLIAGRVARDSKVVLSGTGGDELHGGYVYRYQAMSPAPAPAAPPPRSRLSRWLASRRRGAVHNPRAIFTDMLNFPVHRQRLADAFTPEFLGNVTRYDPADAIGRMLNEAPDHPLDMVLYVDARTYLHGLLVVEDKVSMAHSLETRVPLLDNELVDFVSTLPWSHLFDGTTGKIVFRESVRPWVPEVIYRKPKMGFGPPDASWYRGALRAFIERRLSPGNVALRGVFRPDFVARSLDDHFAGRANNVSLIWSLISFESWCRVFGMLGGDREGRA